MALRGQDTAAFSSVSILFPTDRDRAPCVLGWAAVRALINAVDKQDVSAENTVIGAQFNRMICEE